MEFIGYLLLVAGVIGISVFVVRNIDAMSPKGRPPPASERYGQGRSGRSEAPASAHGRYERPEAPSAAPEAVRVEEQPDDGPELLDLSDYGDQLKAVEADPQIRTKKPVNRSASRVMKLIEEVGGARSAHRYRVLAETPLSAFMKTETTDAWHSVKAKRVDFLVIDSYGHPALAVEFHGHGHPGSDLRKSQAAARDAVKRRALQRANIELVEVQKDYDDGQSRMMIERAFARYEDRGRKDVIEFTPAS